MLLFIALLFLADNEINHFMGSNRPKTRHEKGRASLHVMSILPPKMCLSAYHRIDTQPNTEAEFEYFSLTCVDG